MSELRRKAPQLKKGWMTKQGRSGLVKNWKKRFFVLADGKISYYVDEIPEHPFGSNLKGEMSLVNTELLEDHTRANEKQIFIVSYNGENNILMETENAADSKEWIAAIKNHIQYFNNKIVESVRLTRSASAAGSEIQASAAEAVALSSVNSTAAPATATTEPENKLATPSAEDPAPAINRRQSVRMRPSVSEESKPITGDVVVSTIMDTAMNFATNNEYRNNFISKLLPTLQTAGQNVVENFYATDNSSKGEAKGNRGEKVVLAATILGLLITFGVGNRLLAALISFFISCAAFLMLISGFAIFGNAIWETKDYLSILLTPSANNKVVTSGVYQLVRHPMYCGVIMMAFGWSILQKQIFKIVLSMVLFIVLNFAAEKEEEYMERKHPSAYEIYASSKRAIIPFLY